MRPEAVMLRSMLKILSTNMQKLLLSVPAVVAGAYLCRACIYDKPCGKKFSLDPGVSRIQARNDFNLLCQYKTTSCTAYLEIV
jgi:hypothetical protein